MPLSPSVRTQALVASARHCCVCHRYKGVKVEVHHITPEAEGGPNTFENAIVLCFDCHADAGHYNDQHPRGSKLKRAELELARDEWYRSVKEHAVSPPDEPDLLYCRYLVCKSFDALLEVASADLSRIPVPNPLLVQTPPLDFLRSVLGAQKAAYRHAQVGGDAFPDRAAHHQAHPEAGHLDPADPGFAYFERVRIPSARELRERVGTEDGITLRLLDEGLPSNELAVALGYEELCGGGAYQEIYRLRPLWAVFLAVTNATETPVVLDSVEGKVAIEHSYRSFGDVDDAADDAWSLPQAPLPPDTTAVIPLAVLMGPIQHVPLIEHRTEEGRIESAHAQIVSHVSFTPEAVGSTRSWGPVMSPEAISLRSSGVRRLQAVHELDLQHLYTIDRYWEVGSCPHLFCVREDGSASYFGELFAREPGQWCQDRRQLPSDAGTLIIAELEEEVTYLRRVVSEGRLLVRDLVLEKGQSVRLHVRGGSTVDFEGKYDQAIGSRSDLAAPWHRNELVGEFIARFGGERAARA